MSDFTTFIKDNPIFGGALVLAVLLLILLIFLIFKLAKESKKEKRLLNNQHTASPNIPQHIAGQVPYNSQSNLQFNYASGNNANNIPNNLDTDKTTPLFVQPQVNDAYKTELLSSDVYKPLAKLQYTEYGQVKEYIINSPVITIGRDLTCQLIINSDTHIGRRHAEIHTRGKCFYLLDLNSRNGTYINGLRLEGEKEIFNGDVFRLASAEFHLITL